jgi:hypothetical protein
LTLGGEGNTAKIQEKRRMDRAEAWGLLTVFGTRFYLKDLPCFQSARIARNEASKVR